LSLANSVTTTAPKGERYSDRLRELLPSNAERIAVEPTIPLMIAEIIGSKRVRCELIEEARAIKSDYEVARIAYACRLISDAHAELLKAARIGLSQSEINATIGKAIFARMASDDPNVNPFATKIFTVIQDAAASHDPHNFSNLDMAMREGGPHVSVFNAVLNGYGAEIERTFFLGHVPEAARAPFDVMLEAREKVFELTRPGATMSDVDEAATDVFRKYGYEKNIRHRAGHGMGVTAHEGPFLAAGEMKVISPGMVFTIEPGIYFPGLGGFRYSDTVLTTETGLVCLTKGPTSLAELTL
jgi:Xaa-Pro dipeptidase